MALRGGRVTILTGAGISAESGIPTFREAQRGLWAKYNPAELASPEAFLSNPHLVWDWYTWRRGVIAKAIPNQGHLALASLEDRLNKNSIRCTLITQNIDGLHSRAGNKNIIELHGNIMRHKCSNCDHIYIKIENNHAKHEIPRCPLCGSFVRPDVIWFGEQIPTQILELAWQASENCDIFLSIGTSGIVQPAASFPFIAKQNNAIIVEVNPEITPITPQADYVFNCSSGMILPHLISKILGNE